jgi:hypothetical protein
MSPYIRVCMEMYSCKRGFMLETFSKEHVFYVSSEFRGRLLCNTKFCPININYFICVEHISLCCLMSDNILCSGTCECIQVQSSQHFIFLPWVSLDLYMCDTVCR